MLRRFHFPCHQHQSLLRLLSTTQGHLSSPVVMITTPIEPQHHQQVRHQMSSSLFGDPLKKRHANGNTQRMRDDAEDYEGMVDDDESPRDSGISFTRNSNNNIHEDDEIESNNDEDNSDSGNRIQQHDEQSDDTLVLDERNQTPGSAPPALPLVSLSMESVLEAFELEYPSRKENYTIHSSGHSIPITVPNPILSRIGMHPQDCTIQDSSNDVLAFPIRPRGTCDLEFAVEVAARILVTAKALCVEKRIKEQQQQQQQLQQEQDDAAPAAAAAGTAASSSSNFSSSSSPFSSILKLKRPKYLFDFEITHDLNAPSNNMVGPYLVAVEMANVVKRSKVLCYDVAIVSKKKVVVGDDDDEQQQPRPPNDLVDEEVDEDLDFGGLTRERNPNDGGSSSSSPPATARRSRFKKYSAREVSVKGVVRNSTNGAREATAMLTFHV